MSVELIPNSYARFPQKVWNLLNSRTDAIMWGETGRTIILDFNVLGCYLQSKSSSIFKTRLVSSFIRQLNIYGFRKVTSHLRDPLCNASNPDLHEYSHKFFQRGKIQLLRNITRKSQSLKSSWNRRSPDKISNITYKQVQNHAVDKLVKARQLLRNVLNSILFNKGCLHNFDWNKKNSYEDHYKFNCADNETVHKHSEENTLANYIENFRGSDECPKQLNVQSYKFAEENNVEKEKEKYFVEANPDTDLRYDILFMDVNSKKNDAKDNANKSKCKEYSYEATALDESIKSEDNNLQDNFIIKVPSDKECEELYTNGDPWEYKEILREIVATGGFSDQGYSSELKDLYTQISQTIQILNT